MAAVSLTPLSSMKTIVRRSQRAFLNPRPRDFRPLLDRPLLKLLIGIPTFFGLAGIKQKPSQSWQFFVGTVNFLSVLCQFFVTRRGIRQPLEVLLRPKYTAWTKHSLSILGTHIKKAESSVEREVLVRSYQQV